MQEAERLKSLLDDLGAQLAAEQFVHEQLLLAFDIPTEELVLGAGAAVWHDTSPADAAGGCDSQAGHHEGRARHSKIRCR